MKIGDMEVTNQKPSAVQEEYKIKTDGDYAVFPLKKPESEAFSKALHTRHQKGLIDGQTLVDLLQATGCVAILEDSNYLGIYDTQNREVARAIPLNKTH